MRLTLYALLFTVVQVYAVGSYAQSTRLNLDLQGSSVREVLQEIESISEFRFLYNSKMVDADREVAIVLKGETIETALQKLFNNTDVAYRIVDRQVVLFSKNEPVYDISELQQGTVTGKVSDTSGQPLPGVTVVVKGTTQGTITDANGNYSLANIPDDATLLFSFVGMRSQEVVVGDQTSINVTLGEEVLGLDEVIVIGYGTANRNEYTGSVSSVKLEDSPISFIPNLNALETLKGNVSGLNIGVTNTAGGQPSMLIRGQNSISGSNDPLIILDGVIYMGSINDINPNDIASFDILKDAVSASVYGSRAANGVIAITTKRGSSEKPVISLNTSGGIQTWQNIPQMMKGDEWVKVVNARNQFAEGSTDWMKAGELANLAANRERNWLDEVTRTGVYQDYQLSVSGAAEGLNYYMSTSYNDNKGVVTGDDFERISVLGKINADITNWLEIGVDAGYSRRDYSGFSANIGQAQTMSPYGVMYRDEENKLLEKYPYTQSAINPLWGVDDGTQSNTDIRQNFRLNGYSIIQIPWITGLSYRINFLANLDQNRTANFVYEDYYIQEGEGLGRYDPAVVFGFLARANGNQDYARNFSYVWDNIISYKNRFGKNNVDVTLVATRDKMKYNFISSTGSDFAANGNTTLGTGGLHKATVQRINLDAYDRANIGYLARLSYSFDNRYFLSGSYRHDGASVFGANMKWADYAGFGIAWNVTNEAFVPDNGVLNNLKLKLSWGQNGNQGIGPYRTLSQVASGSSGGYRYEFSDSPGKIEYGLVQSTLGNRDLGWESTTSWNTGFESEWLNSSLFVDVDLYYSETKDQIFTRNIPVMTGFKTITTSMGQVNNYGIELTARSVNISNSAFTWLTTVTFWKNWNELAKLYGEDLDGDGVEDDDIANSLFIGESLGAIYGYEQDGIVQAEDTEYIAMTGAAPGAPKYKNLDNEDGITAEDRKILGFTKENFRLNMGNNFTYGNFDLYVLFTGVFGGNNYFLQENTPAYLTSGTGRFNDNMTSKPYWTPENKSEEYPSATFAGDGRFLGLQSRGFVRLQDVSLSYSFSKQWLDNINIRNLKVYLAAKNLATFTNWDGLDPETGATYRSGTYPVVTTYSLGLNISF